ncbi:MAG TPA: MerR family transcriptional regulator [Candidatus Saccharicenans sp.]|nr:MerR family transcriptional regulator [Candidatus Saccharicenans sp.]
MSDKLYKIEQVSNLTGLTKRAIRYYEDLNLIRPQRTESAYRLYTEEDIEKIKRIVSLKKSLAFSLAEIKQALELDQEVENILSEETASLATINSYIEMIRRQIKLIEEKVSQLLVTRKKFEDLLMRLSSLEEKVRKEETR